MHARIHCFRNIPVGSIIHNIELRPGLGLGYTSQPEDPVASLKGSWRFSVDFLSQQFLPSSGPQWCLMDHPSGFLTYLDPFRFAFHFVPFRTKHTVLLCGALMWGAGGQPDAKTPLLRQSKNRHPHSSCSRFASHKMNTSCPIRSEHLICYGCNAVVCILCQSAGCSGTLGAVFQCRFIRAAGTFATIVTKERGRKVFVRRTKQVESRATSPRGPTIRHNQAAVHRDPKVPIGMLAALAVYGDFWWTLALFCTYVHKCSTLCIFMYFSYFSLMEVNIYIY